MSFEALNSPKLRSFHRRLTILSAAGMFLDGFDLTVIAVALPFLVKKWQSGRASPAWWRPPPSLACFSALWYLAISPTG